MQNRARDDTQRIALVTLTVALLALTVFALWHHFPISWSTSDTINAVVAIGTLSLAASTLSLARYTMQSVQTSEHIIAMETLRHQQSLAPVLTATPIVDCKLQEIKELTVTNAGLGPAFQIMISAGVEYEKRVYNLIDGSFAVAEKKTFPMMNSMAAVLGAQASTRISAGAPIGWTLSGNGFGCGTVIITYRDMFGNFYQSIGGHLLYDFYDWQPAAGLFSLEERNLALRNYLSRLEKKSI